MGAKVFQTGLLTDRRAADIGWSRIPLGRLHGERAVAALQAGGAECLGGERVLRIDPLEHPGSPDSAPHRLGAGFAVRTGDRTIDADGVIVALPHGPAAEVLPPGSFPGQDRVAELGLSPIVDIHLRYDRRVTNLPVAAGVGTRAQWIFDRTASSGLAASADDGAGQYLAVSVSAADEELGRHPDELAATMTTEMARLFPLATAARVTGTLVTKERTATFRAAPGSGALRPGPRSAHPGLAIAGAWTDTGWPATMEGAVRSGVAAARATLLAAGRTRPLPEEVA
jgi:monoamine oxidase